MKKNEEKIPTLTRQHNYYLISTFAFLQSITWTWVLFKIICGQSGPLKHWHLGALLRSPFHGLTKSRGTIISKPLCSFSLHRAFFTQWHKRSLFKDNPTLARWWSHLSPSPLSVSSVKICMVMFWFLPNLVIVSFP